MNKVKPGKYSEKISKEYEASHLKFSKHIHEKIRLMLRKFEIK